jgi:hypothetical protein
MAHPLPTAIAAVKLQHSQALARDPCLPDALCLHSYPSICD